MLSMRVEQLQGNVARCRWLVVIPPSDLSLQTAHSLPVATDRGDPEKNSSGSADCSEGVRRRTTNPDAE